MMRLLFLIPILLLTACATTPAPTAPGGHGERSTVGGVEFWSGGTPTRPYSVLKTTVRQGPDPSATYADEEALLAGDARAAGADAVIVLDEVMSVIKVNEENGALIHSPKVDAQLIKYR